jgi:1,4-dihydroxy-6-naphthoate synthase
MKKLSIGFSSCPNDTFIFDAMIHKRIDTGELSFAPKIGDVEELNRLAFKGELDITKLSYHAFAYLADQYQLLHAGSALGNNCGPLLIAREPLTEDQVNSGEIAIPGKYTTANFLLGLRFPQASRKREMLFSQIEDSVLKGEVAAGLIIHENRFTYQEKGLVKLVDLGEYWEQSTGFPIPLGGIAVRRSLPEEIKRAVNRILRQSVEYAFTRPEASAPFIREHAQEMDPKVMRAHIDLYVNDYSIDLGEKGRNAVNYLYAKAEELGLIQSLPNDIFSPASS